MLQRFCNWMEKSAEFTNSIFIMIILIFCLLVSFMFETVDKYEYLESFHNESICSECGQILHK